MADTQKMIFLSACEASADIHCANLIKALKDKNPDLKFVGLGGDNMAAAGCYLLENTVSKAAMTYKVFSQIGYYIRLLKKVKLFLAENTIDLVVVCDSPAFNFHIAKAAKKGGIKTFFYVAPQLWAWAPWRIGKLKRCCDGLACILPFEQDWFNKRGMRAVFVGNPLLAGKREDILQSARLYQNYNPNNARIALMPGSRKAEIQSLWPVMQKVALRLKRTYKNMSFTAVALNEEIKTKMQAGEITGFSCQYKINAVFETASENDFVFVSSGSATLEVAAAGCPMVVMYQTNKLIWHCIGRFLINTRYLSLVNILAGSELVPELMPYLPDEDTIIKKSLRLIQSPALMKDISGKLKNLTYPLALLDAPQETAEMILQLLEQ